ncbi:MAG TPA: hypothetical protein DD637_02175 [Verrucomicrobia bacterium]|nr:hypothetical protein [Verrucomicrobiota bacterium]HCG19729.1 hypothetical protein [Verrucomicrobiota bacterium]
MKVVNSLTAACLAIGAGFALHAAEAPAQSEAEVWNAGVDAYRANDTANALRLLRPLMLSRTFGARASEAVAALSCKAAHDPLANTNALANLEESARAAQIALRAAPEDARLNRNFTRSTEGLAALREARHVDEVLAAAKGQDPAALLDRAVDDARRLLAAAGTYRTNAAPRAVELADGLARQAAALADVWIPVRAAIAQSATNEQQAAFLGEQIEAAQGHARAAAEKLADMDEAAYGEAAAAEADVTRFNKLTAGAPQALARDLAAQSNAWQDAERINGRPWQNDALDYTRRFRAAFPAWARAYEQQAQSDTNKPPFTPEAQAEISRLSTEVEKLQMECAGKELPPQQEKCVQMLERINELMPKDKNSGGGNASQPQNNAPRQDNRSPSPNDGQDGQKGKPDSAADAPKSEDGQRREDEEREKGGPDAPSPGEQEIEATLKKAQERTDEHEAEKKARMRKAALPPNERDW